MNEALVVCNIVAVVIALLALFRPQPALHKQFADKQDTDKKLDRISEELEAQTVAINREIKELTGAVQNIGGQQSVLRRPMHKTLNAHSNALYFLAGRLSARGEADGERIKNILSQAEQGEGI
jgi:hypothetical protein